MHERVCIIGDTPPYHNAGPAVYVDEISRKTAENINVILITWGERTGTYEDKYGRKVYVINPGPNLSFRAVWRARSACKDCNLIHVNHPVMANMVHRVMRLPVIMTVHGYYAYEQIYRNRIHEGSFRYKRFFSLEKKAFEVSDEIISVGKFIEKYVGERVSNRSKVHYIPNGVDTTKFRPDAGNIRKKLNLSNDDKIILFAKSLTEQNGIKTLMRAGALLSKKRDDFKIILAGKDPSNGELERLSVSLGINSRILFLGVVNKEDMPKYYASSDIFSVPFSPALSHFNYDGFFGVGDTLGLSHLEAMSSALPVLGTKTGIPEGEFDTEMDGSILVTSPGDSLGLSRALSYLLDNQEISRNLGRKAREKVVSDYDLNVLSKRLLSIYEKYF